jgi:hypothetical protein
MEKGVWSCKIFAKKYNLLRMETDHAKYLLKIQPVENADWS